MSREDCLCDVCGKVKSEFFSDGSKQLCTDCYEVWFGEAEVDENRPETVN